MQAVDFRAVAFEQIASDIQALAAMGENILFHMVSALGSGLFYQPLQKGFFDHPQIHAYLLHTAVMSPADHPEDPPAEIHLKNRGGLGFPGCDLFFHIYHGHVRPGFDMLAEHIGQIHIGHDVAVRKHHVALPGIVDKA